MFKYGVTFYSPYDDGSHPFGDDNLRFDTPEAAFAYADATVEEKWQEGRKNHTDKAWYDRAVERDHFVVEVYR